MHTGNFSNKINFVYKMYIFFGRIYFWQFDLKVLFIWILWPLSNHDDIDDHHNAAHQER